MKQANRFIIRHRFAAILCSGLLLSSCLHEVHQVSEKRFMYMIKERNVQRITIVNGNTVEVWLKPYVVANAPYKNIFSNHDPNEPHFILYIVSEKAFRQKLAGVNPKFSNINEERRGFLGF